MRAVLLVLFCLLSNSLIGAEEDSPSTCDLLIRNGRIVDGSGNPWFYADIAIKDGRITDIGKTLPYVGTLEIDAKGLVVSPGFIDRGSRPKSLAKVDPQRRQQELVHPVA
jgi:N-acyl-D-amino-acid deacylase